MKTIVIAGTCSGVGKSTIAAGLMAAYSRRGLRVQPFKIGPDFLDPLYHYAATGRESYNLDTWLLSREAILKSFRRCMSHADLAIVEGVMGLYDGYDGRSERGSTAEIAKLLNAPVLLIFDCWAFSRSAAAMGQGYTSFDSQVKFAGVVFNKINGDSHLACLQEAFSLSEIKTVIVGGIPNMEGIQHAEQVCNEGSYSDTYLQQLADLVEIHLNLDAVLEEASTACELDSYIDTLSNYAISNCSSPTRFLPKHTRIGVARDAAFSFQYYENICLLEDAGAELVYFSPLKDTLPPSLDAIFFGGGHLGVYLDLLSANKQLLYAVRAFADAGGVVFGESGGLMYLSQGVEGLNMQLFPMCGIFPFWTRFRETSRTGYVKVVPQENCILFPTEIGEIRGFTCSSSEIFFRDGNSLEACCKGLIIKEDHGVEDSELEGYMYRNAMITSVHLHFGSNPNAAHVFVERCRMDRSKAAAVAAAAAAAVAEAGPEASAAAGAAAAEAVTAVSRECRELIPYSSIEMAMRRDYLAYHMGIAQKQGEDSTSSESTSYSGTFWPSCTESAQTFQEDKTLRRTESFDLHHLRRTTSMDAHSSLYLRSESEIWDKEQVRAHQLSEECNQDVEYFSSTKMKVSRWNCNGNATYPNNFTPSYRLLGSEQQEHQLKQPPKKIMSLLPWATEIIIELGAGDRLVAVTDCFGRPSGAQCGCHGVGSGGLNVSPGSRRHAWAGEIPKPFLESVVCKKSKVVEEFVCAATNLKPDLVVTHDSEGKGNGNISAQGRFYLREEPRLHFFNPCRVSEIFECILNLGDALGLYVESCSLVERLRTRLRRVAICVAAQKRPRMLLLQGLNPLILGGHWIPEVESLAGGYDGLQKSGSESEMLHWQRIISYAPEVLVLSSFSLSIDQTLCEVELLARLHGFWSIPAVEARQVYVCGHAAFSSPGPRIIDGVELLASILHPAVTSSIQLHETAWKLSLSHGQQCSPQDLKKYFKPYT